MRTIALLLSIFLCLSGCTAGTVYQVLGYEQIDAASLEAEKGVLAYDTAVRAAAVKNHEVYLKKVAADVEAIALSKGETDASAKNLGKIIADGVTKHFAGMAEQERRRAEWLATTLDNLAYIREVCADSKAFAIYRSNVGEQWRMYLQSQARNHLTTMGVSNGRSTATRSVNPTVP